MPNRDVVEANKKLFPPGALASLIAGCKCSGKENCEGRGYQGRMGTWLIAADCPLHWFVAEPLGRKRKSTTQEDE
jgi:hypothetical protein